MTWATGREVSQNIGHEENTFKYALEKRKSLLCFPSSLNGATAVAGHAVLQRLRAILFFLSSFLSSLYCQSSAVARRPDQPFRNCKATKSVSRRFRTLCNMSIDGFPGPKIVNGSVGGMS